MRHGKPVRDPLCAAAIGEKWHAMINQLENHFRDRVHSLRGKLSQILERDGSEDQAVRLLLGTTGTKQYGESRIEEVIREGFNIN